MFCFDSRVGRVRVAFTDRHGGADAGTGESLDLADHPVAANRARLAATFGVKEAEVLLMHQVHGLDVAVVDRSAVGRPQPTADALVTATTGLVLVARAADCVPVAIADPERGFAAVVHSGRPGTQAGVVLAAVQRLRGLGADGLHAWIGPRVCGSCYEVPTAMRDEVAAVEPATWSTTRDDTPGLDLAAGVRAQLQRTGVDVHDLADLADPVGGRLMCTMESEEFFSFRRQGATSGRMGVFAQVQP